VDINDPNIPIIGQQRPGRYDTGNSNDISKTIDVYDTEVLAIEKVLATLRERSMGSRNLQSFNDEAQTRFHEIGFLVDIKWFTTDQADVYAPVIDIVGRTEKDFVFDRDQQVHEVTNDVLELGEGGVIKTNKDAMKALEGHHKH
jgi:hypothetical protein